MPVTIDQIETTMIEPETGRGGAATPASGASAPTHSPEEERRKWRAQARREAVLAARVAAN